MGLGVVVDEIGPAPEAGALRLDQAEDGLDRDGGVHGVAAPAQHLDPRVHRQGVGGGDHGVFGEGGLGGPIRDGYWRRIGQGGGGAEARRQQGREADGEPSMHGGLFGDRHGPTIAAPNGLESRERICRIRIGAGLARRRQFGAAGASETAGGWPGERHCAPCRFRVNAWPINGAPR